MAGRSQGADGPESDGWKAPVLGKSDGFLEQAFAQTPATSAGMHQEPPKLRNFLSGGYDGNGANDPPSTFRDPQTLPCGWLAHELRQGTGDIGFEGRVKAIFPSVKNSMQLNDGARSPG